MRARATSVLCLAAVILSGCGGGSGKSTRTKSTPAPAPTTATASSGAPTRAASFTTVVPHGYTNDTNRARGGPFNFLYLIVGPQRTNINVVRERVGGLTDMDVIARAELRNVKRILPKAHQFSPVTVTTVGGDPARAVDYFNSPTGELFHQRQVFVAHGGWVYVITYTARPALYASHLDALRQVVAGWRWA